MNGLLTLFTPGGYFVPQTYTFRNNFFSTTSTYMILCDFYQILSSHVSGNFGVLTIIISSDIGHNSKQPSKLRSNLHKMQLAITLTKIMVMTWNLEHMLLVSMWFKKYSYNPILTKFPRFPPIFSDVLVLGLIWTKFSTLQVESDKTRLICCSSNTFGPLYKIWSKMEQVISFNQNFSLCINFCPICHFLVTSSLNTWLFSKIYDVIVKIIGRVILWPSFKWNGQLFRKIS